MFLKKYATKKDLQEVVEQLEVMISEQNLSLKQQQIDNENLKKDFELLQDNVFKRIFKYKNNIIKEVKKLLNEKKGTNKKSSQKNKGATN